MLIDNRNATLREYCDHVTEVVDSFALREGWVAGLLTEAFTGKSFESMVNQLAKIESMIPEEMENTLRALQKAVDKAEKDYVKLIRRKMSREEFTKMVAQTKGLADGLSKAIKELQLVLRSRQIKRRVNARLGGDEQSDGETLGDVLDDNHKEILRARVETAFTRPEGMLGRLWKTLSPNSYGWHGLTDDQLLEDMLSLSRDGIVALGDISPESVDDLFPPAVDKAVEDEAEEELEDIDPKAAAKARRDKKNQDDEEEGEERSPGDPDPEEEQAVPIQRQRRAQTPSQQARNAKAKAPEQSLPPRRRPQPKREKIKFLSGVDDEDEPEPEASSSSVAVEEPEEEPENSDEHDVEVDDEESGEIEVSNRSPVPAPARRQKRYEPDDDDWEANPPDATNREDTPARGTDVSDLDQVTQPITPERRRVPLRKPPVDDDEKNSYLDANLARLGIDTGEHQRQAHNRDEDDVQTRSMLDPESDEDFEGEEAGDEYENLDVRDFASNLDEPIEQPADDDDPRDFDEYPQSDMEYLGPNDDADPIEVGDEEDYEAPRFRDPIPVKAYQDRWGRRTDVTDPGPVKPGKSGANPLDYPGFDEDVQDLGEEPEDDEQGVEGFLGKTMVPRERDVTGKTSISDPSFSEPDEEEDVDLPDTPSIDPYEDEPPAEPESTPAPEEAKDEEPQGAQAEEQTPDPQLAKGKPKLSLQKFLDEYLPDGGRNLSKQNLAGLAKLLKNRGFDVEMPTKQPKQKKSKVTQEAVDPTLERWRRLAGIPREMK